MTTDNIGLYVHIPFCIRKCAYCDFASFSGVDSNVRARYIDRLCEEIESYRTEEKIGVDTVFFGGGTPSLLSSHELSRILASARSAFKISPDAEITMEMNPGTVTPDKVRGYASLGVNRACIGCQSFIENELKILGRIHTYEDFLASYASAREAGFDNISVDLMYGIPEGTVESLEKTLRAVTDLSPEHISLYGLIVEEGTPFHKMKDNLNLPDVDTECDMYEMACDYLARRGYSHYEISNYARRGYQCRHNLIYWRDEEYIGVGAAAHSYFKSERYGNSASLDEYFSPEYEKYRCREEIDGKEEAYEYAMMRLRLAEGISLSEYRSRFGKDFTEGKEELIDRLARGGFVTLSADRLSLTDRGMYVNNYLLTELL